MERRKLAGMSIMPTSDPKEVVRQQNRDAALARVRGMAGAFAVESAEDEVADHSAQAQNMTANVDSDTSPYHADRQPRTPP